MDTRLFSLRHIVAPFRNLSGLTLAVSLICCLAVGCGGPGGPELAHVEGTVTVDGKPIDGASVTFEPAGGRPSFGITDANGHYVLEFTATREGALLGEHVVRITTVRAGSGGEGAEALVEARKELLPDTCHAKSELVAQVESGSNSLDFNLESK
ncbi:hypothetical protein Poly24_28170 [Rosistilla carotiformis]|uniref:Carboxypeptidase regulatory-like domain-containing protein n=1 Tax=Rosistilla carotiformis TaxID=2528017 RepID=A0A518JU82_9BACT|nr:Ig-like domain-containing protein [Rosistilla carotiformis]QDV69103.1 hypothetical protein Poly24_28170 [Rosistilla carotiformis]